MPTQVTVRRKHLRYPFKGMRADKVSLEYLKDRKRADRASEVYFLDDADGSIRRIK